MKTGRTSFRMLSREQRMDDVREDSYRELAKMPSAARCPECGAAYVNGRWTWNPAPPGAYMHACPACQRIHDELPAGYVALQGSFLAEHREDILNLARAREARAKEDHPLQRIIAIEAVSDGIIITTTDAHLARGIAVAVHEAFKGTLDMTYSPGENLLRASWKR